MSLPSVLIVRRVHDREVVLSKVDAMVKDFVYQASLAHGLSESIASTSGGKIFSFVSGIEKQGCYVALADRTLQGSYRLGVHGPGSDIDTLCVVPKHVQREDFFSIFEGMLREREEVTELAGVPEAYVPLITAKFMDIPIDFTFARLATPRVEDDLVLQDSNLLKNLDERDVRSLGGKCLVEPRYLSWLLMACPLPDRLAGDRRNSAPGAQC